MHFKKAQLNETSKQQIGLDSQYYLGPYALFTQLDIGKHEEQSISPYRILNGIVELNWRNADETTFIYLQNLYFSNKALHKKNEAHSLVLGVHWQANQQWDLSAQVKQALKILTPPPTSVPTPKDKLLSIQLRYRF